MWSKNASLEGGTLSLAGIPAAQLAKEFGTPAFFLDEDAYRSRALAWHNGLSWCGTCQSPTHHRRNECPAASDGGNRSR